MNLERPPRLHNGLGEHLARVYQEIELEDLQSLKRTGDIDFPHSFRVRGNLLVSVARSITASTTQTQGQQPLTAAANLVETVANANDVVTLPSAVEGLGCEIVNQGANTLQIFPASGDSIQGGSVDASVTLAAGNSVRFRAFDTTDWYIG